MNIDTKYIIENRKHRLGYRNALPLLLLFFNHMIVGFINYTLINVQWLRFLFVIAFSLIMVAVVIKLLIDSFRQTAFLTIKTAFNKRENEKNIVNCLASFKLPIYRSQDHQMLYTTYIEDYRFNDRKDVFLVPLDREILVNIRNRDLMKIFTFTTKKADILIERLKLFSTNGQQISESNEQVIENTTSIARLRGHSN